MNLSTQTLDFRKWIVGRIVRRSTVLLAVVLVVFMSSCNGSDDSQINTDPNSHQGSDDHQTTVQPSSNPGVQTTTQLAEIYFTDSNEDIWPPQPRNISNVKKLIPVSGNEKDAGRSEKTSAKDAKLAIFSDPKLVAELGDNYAVLTHHHREDKAGNLTQIESEFFIYTSNKVLTAKYSANGTVSYTLTDASSYQPPESQQEVQKAVALASIALNEQGFADHIHLKGTALLAYPTASEVAKDGKVFFSDRKLYVTFGPGGGAIPNYRALVNLSKGSVESSGAMQ